MKKQIFGLIVSLVFFGNVKHSFSASRNVIKTAIVPIAFKEYSLYFERQIHRNISFSLGGSFMPERKLPDILENISGGSANLSEISFKGLAIIPEIRIFPGVKLLRPAPRGFYISLYTKIRSFSVVFPFAYNDTTTFDFSGRYTGVGIGMMLGHQWIIGDHLSIDWWISGVHFGSLFSTLDVTDDRLNNISQEAFLAKMGSVSFPRGEVQTEKAGNAAKITVNAPYVGLRSGVTLGIAF